MRIPSVCALVSLLPASSPANTTVVFLETEDAVLPPCFSMIAAASSRFKVVSNRNGQPLLYVNALCMFGGVEIK